MLHNVHKRQIAKIIRIVRIPRKQYLLAIFEILFLVLRFEVKNEYSIRDQISTPGTNPTDTSIISPVFYKNIF